MSVGSKTKPLTCAGGKVGRQAIRMLIGAFLTCLLFFAVFAASAQAFTVRGGTEAQRAYVTSVIQDCSLPSATTDSELMAFGPVDVQLVPLDGQSGYSEIGHIYINADIQPGPVLGELAAHEWAHQIWYSLGPKWWQKWSILCGATPSSAAPTWNQDPAENFAECAKVALWNASTFLRDYPVTDLKVTNPADFDAWLATARYVKECGFADLSPNAMPSTSDQDELAAAGAYVQTQGLMEGYGDGIFGATASLTKGQLALICQRAGLACPASWQYDPSTATRGQVHDTIPGLTWNGDRWSEPITRGQLARLLWRSR
jgi:hypothetical protein